jgi:predicted transposase/invertase (TIGR01784 family)
LTPTASKRLLEGFSATLHGGWTDGIYFLPEHCLTALVVINQLPATTATLWLRLMGRGRVQTQAISELLALPANYPFKRHTLEHLAVLQINLQSRQNRSKDEGELAMNLTPVYQQWREETLQEGRQEGRQEMLLVTVPLLLQTGMTIEQIAKQLNVDVEAVHQATQENS